MRPHAAGYSFPPSCDQALTQVKVLWMVVPADVPQVKVLAHKCPCPPVASHFLLWTSRQHVSSMADRLKTCWLFFLLIFSSVELHGESGEPDPPHRTRSLGSEQ